MTSLAIDSAPGLTPGQARRPDHTLSTCDTGCLPDRATTPRVDPANRIARAAGLGVLLVVAAALAMVLPITSAARRDRLVRHYCRVLLRVLGIRLVVRGDLRDVGGRRSGTLLVANHVSWLDIPVLLAVAPARVLAKREVRDWPVIGLAAARAGTFFIDRGRLRELPTTVATLGAHLRTGGSALVFPEASTGCGRTVGRFYPAMFQAAIDSGAHVVPIGLRYHVRRTRTTPTTPTTLPAFVGDDTLLASLARVLSANRLTVEVHIGQILETGTADDAGRWRARRAMAMDCAEWVAMAAGT